MVRELSGLTQVSSDVCMAKGLREELGMDEGGHSIHGEMCPMRGGSKLSTPCPGPKERTTTFVPSIPQQCFGHEQVSVQQEVGEGKEGWPQHEAGQEEEEEGAGVGVQVQRSQEELRPEG